MKKQVETTTNEERIKGGHSQDQLANPSAITSRGLQRSENVAIPYNSNSQHAFDEDGKNQNAGLAEKSLYLKRLMDAPAIKRSLVRISHEILESNKGGDDLILLGLANGGIEISANIAGFIADIEKIEVPCFVLNASKFRDDFNIRGEKEVHPTDISVSLEGRGVILVDDVLYTGRTVRSAFQALLEFGRPTFVKLAVLVDRGHREFPIRPDFVGKNIPTSITETVTVRNSEVWLEKFNG